MQFLYLIYIGFYKKIKSFIKMYIKRKFFVLDKCIKKIGIIHVSLVKKSKLYIGS